MGRYCSILQLNDLEEDFIYAAEFGDIPTVQKILEDNPHFNVDFSDILGRTPLRLAVGNEHLEVYFLHTCFSGGKTLRYMYSTSYECIYS